MLPVALLSLHDLIPQSAINSQPAALPGSLTGTQYIVYRLNGFGLKEACQILQSASSKFCHRFVMDIINFVKLWAKIRVNRQAGMDTNLIEKQ